MYISWFYVTIYVKMHSDCVLIPGGNISVRFLYVSLDHTAVVNPPPFYWFSLITLITLYEGLEYNSYLVSYKQKTWGLNYLISFIVVFLKLEIFHYTIVKIFSSIFFSCMYFWWVGGLASSAMLRSFSSTILLVDVFIFYFFGGLYKIAD